MTFEIPSIVMHDVLQSDRFAASQLLELKKKKFFDSFKEVMESLEGYKIILLVVASGIDRNPEWVEYIKAHPEWKVECHCWYHEDYTRADESRVYEDLKRAKQKIEETFNQICEWYYPPRNKYNEKTDKIAESLGMKTFKKYRKIRLVRPYSFKWIDMHYWHPENRIKLKTIIEYFKVAEPIFVIGAPRSGTTAYMRYLGSKTKDAVVLKEVEKIWQNDTDIRLYYADTLKRNNAKVVIDKNVRNSLRLGKIINLFPHARFIHLIRDGRAEACSWRKWAIKTHKPDQTIEGAANQWVQYLDAIKKFKKYMKNYEEIRYEDICECEPCFLSRNFKWKKELTPEEIETVEKIEERWLKELGYL
ncbi:MAG TPA: sulfotransferase [Candidatus Glassbacteria bacterium]|nr:sulfotransferase [Candidatus Glassbacteria bacterium]